MLLWEDLRSACTWQDQMQENGVVCLCNQCHVSVNLRREDRGRKWGHLRVLCSLVRKGGRELQMSNRKFTILLLYFPRSNCNLSLPTLSYQSIISVILMTITRLSLSRSYKECAIALKASSYP